jgi:hypothetical protein
MKKILIFISGVLESNQESFEFLLFVVSGEKGGVIGFFQSTEGAREPEIKMSGKSGNLYGEAPNTFRAGRKLVREDAFFIDMNS